VPRYFFHVQDGKDIRDIEGTELAGIAEARDQAVTAAGEMIKHDGDTVWNGSKWRMHVTDEAGRPVFTLHFAADDHAEAKLARCARIARSWWAARVASSSG
jgi:hypothetical protein